MKQTKKPALMAPPHHRPSWSARWWRVRPAKCSTKSDARTGAIRIPKLVRPVALLRSRSPVTPRARRREGAASASTSVALQTERGGGVSATAHSRASSKRTCVRVWVCAARPSSMVHGCMRGYAQRAPRRRRRTAAPPRSAPSAIIFIRAVCVREDQIKIKPNRP